MSGLQRCSERLLLPLASPATRIAAYSFWRFPFAESNWITVRAPTPRSAGGGTCSLFHATPGRGLVGARSLVNASHGPGPLRQTSPVRSPSGARSATSVTGTSDDGGIATWPRRVTEASNVNGHGSKGNFALLDTIHPITRGPLIYAAKTGASARYPSCASAASNALLDADELDGISPNGGRAQDSPPVRAAAVALLEARGGEGVGVEGGRGSKEAQFLVGVMLWKGEGFNRDHQQAVRFFEAAAHGPEGHPSAQFNLGYCSLKGRGTIVDAAKGVEWILAAARAGVTQAEYAAGNCFLAGIGVPKDIDAAAEWYEKAVAKGFQPHKQPVESSSDACPPPRIDWRRHNGIPAVRARTKGPGGVIFEGPNGEAAGGKHNKTKQNTEDRTEEKRPRRGPKSMSAGVQEAVKAKKAKRRAALADILKWRDQGYPGA